MFWSIFVHILRIFSGRGAQLSAMPISSPDSPGPTIRNGCTATRDILLAKTDVAMASLLVRLDQVAAQCSAAQVHGGGRLISEEKFQVKIYKTHFCR